MIVLKNLLTKFPFSSSILNWNYGSKIFVAGIFLYTVLFTSWIGDDALITFRQIWNFITGNGISFNYEIRVQAFTHPLWFLVLSSIVKVSTELFLTTTIVSIVFSFLSILILLGMELIVKDYRVLLIPVTTFLLFSWSFVDYMTSGLENALSYFLTSLLLLIFSLRNWPNNYAIIFLILSLLVLNRLDYVILFLPLVIYLIFKAKSIGNLLTTIIPGLLAIILWFLFATFYFGSPLPNTFFAKLSSGFSKSEYFVRGIEYVFALIQDPITILILLSGVFVSIFSLNKILISLVIGQILYLLYIIYIGGDFMQGRFFSILTLLSIGELIIGFPAIKKISFEIKNLILVILLFFMLMGNFIIDYPFNYDTNYIHRKPLFKSVHDREFNFITDERGNHYQKMGLFSSKRSKWPEITDYPNQAPKSYKIVCGWLGDYSISIQNTYLIDVCGLSDPLLSRIPAVKIHDWVIGHQIRKTPTDYGEFLVKNVDRLPDQNLNPLLADIMLVTTGELVDFGRLKAIWRLNSGFYSDLELSIYRDKDIWVPSISNYEYVNIESWEIGLNYMEFYSNIIVKSDKPSKVTELFFLFDDFHDYEIYINDEFHSLASQMGFSESTKIILLEPILLKSIKIKVIKGRFRDAVSNFVEIRALK